MPRLAPSLPLPLRRALLLLMPLATACEFVGSHFDGDAWTGALLAQTRAPDQLLLELGLLQATAATAIADHDLQQEAVEDQRLTEGSTANGDGTAIGLTALALGAGVGEWANGDDGHALEVLLESFLLTEGVTEGLKYTVGRQRPSKDSKESFPSGHTSYAFTMATFLQRRIAAGGGDLADLGYLCYLPAAYVGINRVEANRHWPSDVAFGAFLGVFLTNVVHDLHYGGPDSAGLFGVRGLDVEPTAGLDGTGAGFELVYHF